MFDLAWWLSAAALFLGCTVQTAMGFGMAVVAAPIIVLYKPEWIPVIPTIVALMLSLQNAWNQRSGIEWKHMAPAMISRFPGTILGAWVLTLLAAQMLQLAVAAMVFVAIFVTVFAKPFPATVKNLSIAGFISGITGTTTSIGGPPMALVMQHSSGHNTRANLSIYFTYSCIIALISFWFLGILTPELILTGVSFLPAALSGYLVGIKARPWVDVRFRPLLLILCSFSAIVAIIGVVT